MVRRKPRRKTSPGTIWEISDEFWRGRIQLILLEFRLKKPTGR